MPPERRPVPSNWVPEATDHPGERGRQLVVFGSVETTVLVAAALGGGTALALALAVLMLRVRNRRRIIPDELRPVIIEEALKRARSKQRAAQGDLSIRHARASGGRPQRSRCLDRPSVGPVALAPTANADGCLR